MDEFGIPASLVAKYLDERGIIVEKPVHTTCCSVQHWYRQKPKSESSCARSLEFKRL